MQRLNALLPWINGHQTLLDIGTDHAELPITAIQQKIVQKAYASDNKDGPLKVAKTRVIDARFDHVIEVLKGDGFDALNRDVDVVVIAGIGGGQIGTMLQKGPWLNVKTIIVQPTNKVSNVRQITQEIPWQVSEEMITVDKGIPYISLKLTRGKRPLSQTDILFGPDLLRQKDPAYKALLHQDLAFLKTLLSQIPEHATPESMRDKATMLEDILDDWT